MKEIWKDIPGYEGYYQASNLGKIKSTKSKNIRKQTFDKFTGYYRVDLKKNGKRESKHIHRWIALTFLGFKSNHQFVIDHINGIKTDNRVENLRIVTSRENAFKGNTPNIRKRNKLNNKNKKIYYEIKLIYKNKPFYLGTYNSFDDAKFIRDFIFINLEEHIPLILSLKDGKRNIGSRIVEFVKNYEYQLELFN